jgi:hypothetical protein
VDRSNLLRPLLIGVVPLLLYLGVCAVVAARGNRPVQPGPPTMDLGPEPPAVVNLLVHRGDLTEDAAEATLLDLAARRILELRGLGPDPRQTTVHVRVPAPRDLLPYERMVFDRVTGRAVDGVVPLTALAFADRSEARRWMRALRAAVATDAKQRGLTGYRMSGGAGLGLIFGSLPALFFCCFGVTTFGLRVDPTGQREEPTLVPRLFGGACVASVLFFVVIFLAPLLSRWGGISPYGRRCAAYWLGVREWLLAHPSFADLPPAAVAVWDRYLAYGAALGTTTVASRVIDLGLAERHWPWSSYGGRWRRVHVRTLRGWSRVRSRPGVLLVAAGVLLGVTAGYAALGRPHAPPAAYPLAAVVPLVALYWLVRLAVDAVHPVEVTGVVLWNERGGSVHGEMSHRRGQLALDDGTADEIRAWLATRGVAGGVGSGDTIRATVRPWSRRVVRVTLLSRPAASVPASAAAWADALSADVVAAALGRPVRMGQVDGHTFVYESTVDGAPLVRLRIEPGPDGARPPASGPGWARAPAGTFDVVITCWPPADPGTPARLLATALARLAR